MTMAPNNLKRIILHAAWVPSGLDDGGSNLPGGPVYLFWAEVGEQPQCPPRLLPEAEVSDILLDRADTLRRQLQLTEVALSLPTGISRARKRSGGKQRARQPRWKSVKVQGLATSSFEVFSRLLSRLQSRYGQTSDIRLSHECRFWTTAAQFALELLVRERFLLNIVRRNGTAHATWEAVLDESSDSQRFEELAAAMPSLCRSYNREAAAALSPASLLKHFLNWSIESFIRGSVKRTEVTRLRLKQPWLLAGFGRQDRVKGVAGSFVEDFQAWRQPVTAPASAANFRTCFRLDPPEGDSSVGKQWSLKFFLQAKDDLSLLVPIKEVWKERSPTLRYLNRRFDHPQEKLLADLGLASRIFPPMTRGLKQPRPEACRLDTAEAYQFLMETSALFEQSGFGILVPTALSRARIRLRIGGRKGPQAASPSSVKRRLGLGALVEYDWQIAIGDETLSPSEFEELAALKVPLVQVRGRWVELNREEIEAAIRYWQKRDDGGFMSLREAMSLTLGQGESPASREAPSKVGEVKAEGWFKDLIDRFSEVEKLEMTDPPKSFRGRLRPYQVKGVSWLRFLERWGLGALLADDMGLGKTIQVIGLLLKEREQGHARRTLLICPTSVVGNWQREVARFAPSLKLLVHHGSDRRKGEAFIQAVENSDLVVTSFALARRDAELLAGVEWGRVVLDEAQNIKNYQAKQTQSIRRLRADCRLALTGTPIENRLTELWSIMDFLNPGYLGPQKRFIRRFSIPIERYKDRTASERLSQLVRPYVLRRLKTDPKVIQDLPEKLEMKVFCPLTREQATLYQAVVKESMRQIEAADGIGRRGVILATLSKLKQVCNHPAHFLGDGSALEKRSGKLIRLEEMLEEVLAVGDRALIFTQFAEMGHLLKSYLERRFHQDVLFLHGGVRARKRQAMIDRFQQHHQGPKLFILSLKAGGLGLNLTQANHVFHFDRWWNPAVEDQATDRAFRIGQRRNVEVHKFVCQGTLEEKIDALIEDKKALAASIIGTGEAWLTDMSTEQLKDLFRLSREAVMD